MAHKPIIIGHHLMWTLYGWWLPNDPRGSTSHSIRSDLVAELWPLHLGRKQLQPRTTNSEIFTTKLVPH